MNQDKIKAVLLCPSYMKLETKLYNSILLSFNNELNIIATVRSEEQLNEYNFQLLISTIMTKANEKYESVIISPFSGRLNKIDIQEKIEKCMVNKKDIILKKHFDDYFEADLFYHDIQSIKNKKDAIEYMTNHLEGKEYVNSEFALSVIDRERAASTAFNCIAIPHSIEANAYKTSISVLLMNQGLNWNGQYVNIVLLMSLSPYESNVFSNLYEALILLFSDNKNVLAFQSCNSFSTFKNTVLSLIK